VEKFRNKRAVRHQPAVTFPDHRLQYAPHVCEVANSRIKVLEMSGGAVANFGAGTVATINEFQQFPNLLQGETEFPATLDE
jgi:hypothetical protein